MKIFTICLITVLTVFVSIDCQAQSFLEAQVTIIDDGSISSNLVARPAVNLGGRWNLQALVYINQEWAEMYAGPQYLIVQPSDSLDIIQMCLLVGAGLETTNEYCFGSILEAVGSNWDALVAVEYGSLGFYYKSQFSYGIIGSPTSFVGLGLYGEKGLGVGPRLVWANIQDNNQVVQLWVNLLHDPKPYKSFVLLGATYLW